MQIYETTIVIDSLQKAEDMQATITKLENFIKNNGGTIVKKEEWGKKRLAYEINRKQYGTYYHLHFEGPGTLPGLLEREYRLEESILRYLTVKTDSKTSPQEKSKKVKATKEAPAETSAQRETSDQDEISDDREDFEPIESSGDEASNKE